MLPNRHLELDDASSSASHALGFLAAVCLLVYAEELHFHNVAPDSLRLFASSMMAMYLCSTLLHAMARRPHARLLERLDRASIHVFIAASYSLLAGPAASALASGGVWLAAITCAVAALIGGSRAVWPYLVTGWSAVAALAWGVFDLRAITLVLVIAGAIAYTWGIRYFLASGTATLAHTKWHLCVLLGSALHTAGALA